MQSIHTLNSANFSYANDAYCELNRVCGLPDFHLVNLSELHAKITHTQHMQSVHDSFLRYTFLLIKMFVQ